MDEAFSKVGYAGETMINESVRPMNDTERKTLQSWIVTDPTPVGFAKSLCSGLGLLSLALVLVVVFFGSILPSNPPMWIGVPVAVVSFIGGVVCFFLGGNVISGAMRARGYRRIAIREGNPRIKAALDDGTVKVLSVSASSVVAFEQFEDEGDGYLFEVGPDTSFLLKGQDAYPVEESMPWPAGRFEVVTTSTSGLRIGIFGAGETLTPRLTVPLAETKDDFIWDSRLEVINQPASEILRSLLKPTSNFNSSLFPSK